MKKKDHKPSDSHSGAPAPEDLLRGLLQVNPERVAERDKAERARRKRARRKASKKKR